MEKLFCLFSIIFLCACANDIPRPVPIDLDINPFGRNNTFEIATWNIEYFPKLNKTSELVKEIIEDLDIDLIAVQEIASIAEFNQMLADMPDWKGVLSSDSYSNGSYQKTGLIYKSQFISVSSVTNIFEDDTDAFPRPPLRAFVEIIDFDSIKYSFNIIVVHLKASGFGDEQDNIRRRLQACRKLESYIVNEIANGADADFIVLGDWNDELSDTSDNVFEPFLEKDSLYSFLTLNVTEASYPSLDSRIDHIMITCDSFLEFNAGEVLVLKLEDNIAGYENDISDHRPIAARFSGFNINLD